MDMYAKQKEMCTLHMKMKSTEVLNPRRSAFDGKRHVSTHKLTSSHGLVYYTVGIRIFTLFCVESLGQNTKPLSRETQEKTSVNYCAFTKYS